MLYGKKNRMKVTRSDKSSVVVVLAVAAAAVLRALIKKIKKIDTDVYVVPITA